MKWKEKKRKEEREREREESNWGVRPPNPPTKRERRMLTLDTFAKCHSTACPAYLSNVALAAINPYFTIRFVIIIKQQI